MILTSHLHSTFKAFDIAFVISFSWPHIRPEWGETDSNITADIPAMMKRATRPMESQIISDIKSNRVPNAWVLFFIHALGLGPRKTRFNVALRWRSCTIHPLVWVGAYDHHEMSSSLPLVVTFFDMRLTKVRVPVRKDAIHKAMDELSMETRSNRCLLDQHLGSIAWPTKVNADILLYWVLIPDVIVMVFTREHNCRNGALGVLSSFPMRAICTGS